MTAPGSGHLFARLRLVELRVRTLVAFRRQDDPAPDDPFRGLYLSDEDVAHLIWTTNSPEFYLLTTARGRTSEHYVATVTDLWIRTLLA